MPGQVGQLLGRHRDADAFELGFQLWQLVGLPLAFVGLRGASGRMLIEVERPTIFLLYEQNVGLLTPLVAEELREAEERYPAEWIEEAFRLAIQQNKRKWSYIRAILKRWETEGKAG